jgi:glycosyltransferase involved in cell wall biosynthesis
MKILIIGDWPKYFGGVVNYTRPLSEKLQERGHEVMYLYSNANLNIRTIGNSKISEVINSDFKFRIFCLRNGKAFLRNYHELSLDYNGWMNNLFEDFIKINKPDIVHIHEIFGFSSAILEICAKYNIPVVNTIHEYWFLCPHRVMVDFNRKICEGPISYSKCAKCISVKLDNFKSKRIMLSQLSNYYAPNLTKNIKSLIKVLKSKIKRRVLTDILEIGNLIQSETEDRKIQKDIEVRLKSNIRNLNKSDLVIGVSSDVQKHLLRYGVNPEKILIQHIGSLISEKKIEHNKEINKNLITFGFIGGVSYYKGVHLIVDAYINLTTKQKKISKLVIYGHYDLDYYNAILARISKSDTPPEKIKFFGSFLPSELPSITNNIDICVLPSLCADTAPQTIFESYAAGLPIIASNVGGFPDFINHGVNGYLFEAGNSEDLSEYMKEIIENPNIIKHFNLNIPTIKTLDKNVNELIILYENIIKNKN